MVPRNTSTVVPLESLQLRYCRCAAAVGSGKRLPAPPPSHERCWRSTGKLGLTLSPRFPWDSARVVPPRPIFLGGGVLLAAGCLSSSRFCFLLCLGSCPGASYASRFEMFGYHCHSSMPCPPFVGVPQHHLLFVVATLSTPIAILPIIGTRPPAVPMLLMSLETYSSRTPPQRFLS